MDVVPDYLGVRKMLPIVVPSWNLAGYFLLAERQLVLLAAGIHNFPHGRCISNAIPDQRQ